MAEVIFARQFLAALDSRPMKLSADHVEDAKNFPARPPYTLPKMPKPFSKPDTKLAPGRERSVTVHVKSLRNPPLDVKLSSQPLDTSVLDLKTKVAEQTGVPVDKMRILHRKKPVVDSKVLKELVAGEEETVVEFSVMVSGGAAAVTVNKASDGGSGAAVAAGAGATGAEALDTSAFWEDLKGFLMQRLKDEKKAEELARTWRAGWEASR